MTELTVVSLLSQLSRPAHTAISAWLRDHAGIAVRLVSGPPWQVQLRMLDAGMAHVAFIGSFPFVHRTDTLEALVAPVQAGPRYQGRPVLFADVVVRRESRFRRFADLRGASIAYCGPGSLSGYEVLQAHLGQPGGPDDFFGATRECGGQLEALGLLVEHAIDAVLVDSTMLELALGADPGLNAQLRSVSALGPYPAPPVAIARNLPATTKAALRAALIALGDHSAGRAALDSGRLLGFVPVSDADYEPIRKIAPLREIALS
jgi:ABC-type phosphate/phosphonate transport system substrate-binding protein